MLLPQAQGFCGNQILKVGVKCWYGSAPGSSQAFLSEPRKSACKGFCFFLLYKINRSNLYNAVRICELSRAGDWGIPGFLQYKNITAWQNSSLSLRNSKLKLKFELKISICLHLPGFYKTFCSFFFFFFFFLLSSKLACTCTDFPFTLFVPLTNKFWVK